MSVQSYPTTDGQRYRVRWRDGVGRMRSRTFTSRAQARAFDIDIKARKLRGEPLPKPGRQTLAGAWAEYERQIAPRLAEATRRSYRAQWNAHIRDRFDHHTLAALSAEPQLVDELVEDMEARGVGRASQRKTLIVLSALLTQCVRWQKMATNPVRGMVKPTAAPRRKARPFPPLLIERIRQELAARATKDQTSVRGSGDALLVSLLAYGGLRPQEALALRWADIGKRTITVDKAASFGEEKATKTESGRSVPLCAPLADDLAAWRRANGGPHDPALVFPGPSGALWSHSAFNNWRSRVWRPALVRLAAADPNLGQLVTARPYDCRHSFVSLHLRASENPIEVAEWAGHAPDVMWRHYAHVVKELRGEPVVPVDRQILFAREVIGSRPDEEVRAFVVEGLKPPSEASEAFRRALFAPRSAQ